MNKIILILISSFLFATNSYAKPDNDFIYLSNLSIIKLNDIPYNKLYIHVGYPGKRVSGSCSIVIRSEGGDADGALKKLADRFIFTKIADTPIIPDSSNNAALVFPLKQGTFVDRITIETKDGKSIGENVTSASIGYVGVFAGVCA
jgi:hypothetical protein